MLRRSRCVQIFFKQQTCGGLTRHDRKSSIFQFADTGSSNKYYQYQVPWYAAATNKGCSKELHGRRDDSTESITQELVCRLLTPVMHSKPIPVPHIQYYSNVCRAMGSKHPLTRRNGYLQQPHFNKFRLARTSLSATHGIIVALQSYSIRLSASRHFLNMPPSYQ